MRNEAVDGMSGEWGATEGSRAAARPGSRGGGLPAHVRCVRRRPRRPCARRSRCGPRAARRRSRSVVPLFGEPARERTLARPVAAPGASVRSAPVPVEWPCGSSCRRPARRCAGSSPGWRWWWPSRSPSSCSGWSRRSRARRVVVAGRGWPGHHCHGVTGRWRRHPVILAPTAQCGIAPAPKRHRCVPHTGGRAGPAVRRGWSSDDAARMASPLVDGSSPFGQHVGTNGVSELADPYMLWLHSCC